MGLLELFVLGISLGFLISIIIIVLRVSLLVRAHLPHPLQPWLVLLCFRLGFSLALSIHVSFSVFLNSLSFVFVILLAVFRLHNATLGSSRGWL